MIFAALSAGSSARGCGGWPRTGTSATDDVLGSLFSGSGLVFYGGALGGAVGCSWAWRKQLLEPDAVDMGAAPLAAGYAIGRIGCQLAGDGDYGIPWDGPWAMAYPNGTVPTTEKVHPTPVYETIVMGWSRVLLWRWRDRLRPGDAVRALARPGRPERFLVEFIRRNEEVLLGLTQPQLISIAMIARRRRLARGHRGAAPPRPRSRPARAPHASAPDSDNRAPHGRRHAHVLPEASDPRRPACSIGGCDARRAGARVRHARLRRRRGRPARPRARLHGRASRPPRRPGEVVFASKAFPVHRGLRLFAEEGLGCDVASGGELHLALRAGFDPERIYLHGNAKSDAELRDGASTPASGTIVLDNADELERLERLGAAAPQRVLLRVTPGVAATRTTRSRPARPTRSSASRWTTRRAAIARLRGSAALELAGPAHAHRLAAPSSSSPFRARDRGDRRARRLRGPTTSAAGSASPTRADEPPPTSTTYVARDGRAPCTSSSAPACDRC